MVLAYAHQIAPGQRELMAPVWPEIEEVAAAQAKAGYVRGSDDGGKSDAASCWPFARATACSSWWARTAARTKRLPSSRPPPTTCGYTPEVCPGHTSSGRRQGGAGGHPALGGSVGRLLLPGARRGQGGYRLHRVAACALRGVRPSERTQGVRGRTTT